MTSQSNVKKLFGQSSHYVMGTILATVSHLITFPIFTRLFSVADYGILSLITVGISTTVAFSKLGLTSASVRMYEECKAEESSYNLGNYYSTFFLAICASASIVTVLYAIFAYFFSGVIFGSALSGLFLFTSIIVLSRTIKFTLMSFLRAEQKTRLYNVLVVLFAYVGSGLSVVLVLFFIKGLWGFYVGQVIIEGVAVTLLLRYLFKSYKPCIKDFSISLLKEGLKYGVPLVGLEFLNHILSYGDRFFITLFCPPESLGLYSVGYNLSAYVSNVLLVPLLFAVTPLLMQTWTRDGKAATQKFLSSSLRYIALVLFPVFAGFIAVGKELLLLLASSKYSEASIIIPFAAVGIGCFALANFFNSGLIVYKKTNRIFFFSLSAAIINTVLNVVLIPRYNIVGAAVATLVAYGFFLVAIAISSFRLLPYSINYKKIFLYFVSSIIMTFITTLFSSNNLFLSLLVKVIMGVVVYCVVVLILDSEIRCVGLSMLKKWKNRV